MSTCGRASTFMSTCAASPFRSWQGWRAASHRQRFGRGSKSARKVQADTFQARGRGRTSSSTAIWDRHHRFRTAVNGTTGSTFVSCDEGCLRQLGKNLMRAAVRHMDLSARAYHRVLKLGRTIADLAGEKEDRSCAFGRGDPVPAAPDGVGETRNGRIS